MNEGKKPCATCGGSSVGQASAPEVTAVSAAGTYDLLRSWGVNEDAAAAAVDNGVRATSAHDAVSVLATALSASSERSRVCEEAFVQLETEYAELESQYNVIQEAFEGSHSEVGDQGDEG